MPRGLVTNSVRMHTAAKLFAEAVAKGEKKTQAEIAKAAGYKIAKNSGAANSIMRGKSFQALLQKYLPMEKIVNTHKELLEQEEDKGVRLRATELGYKVSGVTLDRSASVNANINFDAADVTFQDE